MMPKPSKRVSAAFAVAAVGGAAAVAWQQGDIVVTNDPGGNVAALYAQYHDEYEAGGRHVIAGRCASACTMRLAFPTTCTTADARLGFHKAYYLNFFGWKIGSTWGTNYMLARYPDEVRQWLDSKGGISHSMKWLEGEELRAIVPQCNI